MEEKKISICANPNYNKPFIGPTRSCVCCGAYKWNQMYTMDIGNNELFLCRSCLDALYTEAGHALHKSVEIGDMVWELSYCADGQLRIFPMVVKAVSMTGTVRRVKSKDPTVWNIYAESPENGYSYMYKNFDDVGRTLFFSEDDANAKFNEMQAAFKETQEDSKCQENTQ